MGENSGSDWVYPTPGVCGSGVAASWRITGVMLRKLDNTIHLTFTNHPSQNMT